MNTHRPDRAASLHRLGAGRLARVMLAACAALAVLPAAQAQDEPERKVLKVCQDPNNMPFSNLAAEGIENKLAEVFGQALGLPVEYYSFPARLAFIRNTLRYKLPGEDYRCDIVMGVPVGFDQVSVTKPYYRSTYAMVYAQGRGLDDVKTVQDFLALPPERRNRLRIGLYDRTPASAWLNKHGLVDQGVPYQMMSPDPAQYPGELLEKELAAGKVDVAIVWGPIAGFFAKRVSEPRLAVLPMPSEPGVRFDYEMAMGVRYGEREWKQQVEKLLETRRAEITAILRDFRVPLVGEGGTALP
ncbi:quinoprotein dehydrogenase-associated putative ABC transporter substrate-binding protein [Leptothrix discophora]|uniref:Quinoprotein dehydrogenase-associated putative ABC transporter substrate-binding protein n=1 Tax=Leptothrix discophora TaxID=89 RepID=A0ABT9G8F8_LEPDI|nr:quinoprotein dehydrogenase-associated putative ABC transporter substrate-binding protein [Leptothrix discophora]MDP4302766.1 quinoprotein dehydrogenase-associated putative ABC transporter substrate-binding protein [Leptothrix discophora]